ncbi:MAG: ATP-binding protein [Planctomycetota bacterium]
MTKGNAAVPWKYDQQIASNPNNCSKVIELLLDQLSAGDWSGKDTFGIHMAMEEAIMNAICHGNQRCETKHVHIEIEISDESFYARISDQGEGFKLEDVPDPTAIENLEKTSGRGVRLIQHFIDVVKYNENGNSVELKKMKSSD